MEKVNKAPVFAFLSDNAAPMLLSAAVVGSATYIYACGNSSAVMLFAAVSFVYSAVIFLMYELLRVKGKTLLTTACVSAAFIVSVSLGLRLADMSGANDLGLWFMEPSRYTQVYYGNTFALIAVMGFILISCLYYFTRVRSRSVFVFLICLCPFCLFAKTFTDIPVICPILIMTLFFFIMIGSPDRSAGRASRSITAAIAAFVLAVTVIASFFPKIESAPFRDDFDEFITGVTVAAPGAADFTGFSDTSSAATSDDDDTVVFMIYGDDPVYIKRQCFNIYDPAENTWGYYGNSQSGWDNWKRYVRFEDPTVLYEAAGFDSPDITERKCRIRLVSGMFNAIYTTDNMTGLELYQSDSSIYRTELDEYFIQADRRSPVRAYTVEWADLKVDTAFSDAFTDELASELNDASSGSDTAVVAASYIRAKNEAEQYNEHLLSDEVMDACYSSSSARRRVRELAEKLTGDSERPYDKAAALVDYFTSGEYIYDDEFTTPDPSPDNFILNTKRGACAAYATAMTLMCRELGLTARYCEGFLVQDFNEGAGAWEVKVGDAHAFVQVWIDGYGWTTFDPTSSVTDDGYFDMTFIWVGAVAALLFAAGTLTVVIRPHIKESLFVRRMKKERGAKQYSSIYGRMNARINSMLKERVNKLTPTDTAEKCRELLDFDISGFVQDYEKAVYGGADGVPEDNSAVYAGFAAAYKNKLKEERKRRKK